MKTCDQYREFILEHLYGLLEPSETAELNEHLAGCSACQAELTQAQKQRKLLGVAARTQISGFRFSPPAKQPVFERSRGFSGGGLRWAIAAGLLLAVAGIGIPGAYYWHQENRVASNELRLQEIDQSAKNVSEEYHARIAKANSEVQSLQKQMQDASGTRQQKINEIVNKINSERLNMTVTGPQTLTPGAPTSIRVATTDLNNQSAAASISVKVVNDKDEVLFKKSDLDSKGNQEITLPADLPVSSTSELSLVVSARNAQGGKGELTEKIRLATPVLVTHLATDKPMYQPGETVHFRSLTLDRSSLKPANEDMQLVYTLTKPTGEKTELLRGNAQLLKEKDKSPLLGPDQKPVRGIGAGDYSIDPSSPGGEYTITVSEANNRFPAQDRKFIVNRYEKPRLNKELEFTAKAYGPGDAVAAACKAARVEGGKPVAGQPVTATVHIDGASYAADGKPGGPLSLRTDAQGGVSIKFRLPPAIQTGQATLSVTFQDQGVTEVMVRPIPIVLKKLNIEFFPEGGDLVAGVNNRVYFQVRTTLDKPAELKGKVVDDAGKEVAEAQTFNDPAHPEANQGMGLFSFIPQTGKKYQLKIENPVGMEGKYELPGSKAEGVVLTAAKGVTNPDEPLSIKIESPDRDRSLVVGAYCRGRLLAHQPIEIKKGESKTVDLLPDTGSGGVVRVTVFERLKDANNQNLLPLAERLVYRTPKDHLNLEIKADHPSYVPGDRVKVSVKSTDAQHQTAPAIVMVAVVDKSVLKLADEKTYRSMPAHVLLTSEVRRPEDLEHADFLLGQTPAAAQALDLLLGTQGWRRFAEQDPGKFQKERGEEAQRLLVLNGQFQMQSIGYAQQAIQEVEKSFQTDWTKLQTKMNQASQELADARQGEKLKAELRQLKEESDKTTADYRTSTAALNEYRDFLSSAYFPAAKIVLVLLAVICVAVAISRRAGSRMPSYAVAVCCLVLVAVVSGVPMMVGQGDRGLPKGAVQIQVAGHFPALDKLAKAPWDLEMLDEGALRDGAMPAAAGMAGAGAGQGRGGMMGRNGLMRNEGMPQGMGMPMHAAPGAAPPGPPKPEMAERDFRFGMQQVQQLNRDPALLGLKPEAKLAEQLAKEKGKAAPVRLHVEAELLQQKRENKKDMPLQKALQDADKAALVEEAQVQGEARMMRGGAARRAAGGLEVDRKQMMAGRFAGPRAQIVAAPEPLIVREYAHLHTHGEGNIRTDFAETLYWQPAVVLADGQTEVTFELCDSVTTFQVLAAGHTLDGRIGEATAELTSRKPLVLQPKLPIEVTAGDQIDIPLSIANNTNNQQSVDLKIETQELNLIGGKTLENLTLHPEERTRRVYRFRPTIVEGEAKLRVTGETEKKTFEDSIEAGIKVAPQGFPIVGSQSDLLEGSAKNDVILPETWLPGTLKYQVAFYPSTLADLQKGLEAMLREPGGCFEQTSTSNYPNLLVLNYLKETDQAKPEVARRAQDLLARGYQMLTSFECLDAAKNQRRGYEWFGGTAPAHEALTAYGLMEFRDMAKVYDVDKAMLDRTQKYLMNQKDGKGGFKRNPQALDTFGRAPENITNAYIVWSLTESGGDDDVTKELNTLADQAKTSKDPYFLALVAHSLINRSRQDEGIEILKKVAEMQKPDGHLDATETSITGSGGRDLQIETTALALHAWLKAKRPELFNRPIQLAVKWVGQQRGGFGGFGSTQSTILALKALIAFAKANKKTAEAGDLIVYLSDKEVARKHFAAGAEEAVSLDLADAEKLLKPGKNSLRIEITGKNSFPYTATWSYRSLKPANAENCPVQLATKLDRDKANEGDTVRLTVQVENKSGKGQGMTVAVVGLPAGVTLPEDMKQLKDMARLRNNGTERGEIDAWETRGRELVLYWRDLAPDKKIEVNVQLICRVPGVYQSPASRAYLYYNADTKCWTEPLKVAIRAQEK
jgi:uncharacterized protein YfaS (alpha-2-macroglobulin family)